MLLCVAAAGDAGARSRCCRNADAGRVVGAHASARRPSSAWRLASCCWCCERWPRAAWPQAGSQFSAGMVLRCWARCSAPWPGYFALQPMMAAARAGQGALSFGQLHADQRRCSSASRRWWCWLLAWRAAGGGRQSTAFFLTLVTRCLARLICAAGGHALVAEDLDLLDLWRGGCRSWRTDSTLTTRGPGMRSSRSAFSLGGHRPPQHQQLADVLDRRGVERLGQLGEHGLARRRGRRRTRAP